MARSPYVLPARTVFSLTHMIHAIGTKTITHQDDVTGVPAEHPHVMAKINMTTAQLAELRAASWCGVDTSTRNLSLAAAGGG